MSTQSPHKSIQYYQQILQRRKISLALKWLFDRLVSLIMLVLLSPIILVIAVWIKIDSPGPVFYRQVRVTTHGREFRIFKFRTMVVDADQKGAAITQQNDDRITKVGHLIRDYRLDEIPQLINVLIGQMSFVGTRPEVPKYVAAYT